MTTYYHGTSHAAALKIIEERTFSTKGKSRWLAGGEPMQDRVYFTRSLQRALDYAVKAVPDPPSVVEAMKEGLDPGKIEIPEDEMVDFAAVLCVPLEPHELLPDEDWVGGWAHFHKYTLGSGDIDERLYDRFGYPQGTGAFRRCAAHPRWASAARIRSGDYAFPKNAMLGKRIIAFLQSEPQLRSVLDELAAVAHQVSTTNDFKVSSMLVTEVVWNEDSMGGWSFALIDHTSLIGTPFNEQGRKMLEWIEDGYVERVRVGAMITRKNPHPAHRAYRSNRR